MFYVNFGKFSGCSVPLGLWKREVRCYLEEQQQPTFRFMTQLASHRRGRASHADSCRGRDLRRAVSGHARCPGRGHTPRSAGGLRCRVPVLGGWPHCPWPPCPGPALGRPQESLAQAWARALPPLPPWPRPASPGDGGSRRGDAVLARSGTLLLPPFLALSQILSTWKNDKTHFPKQGDRGHRYSDCPAAEAL